MKTSLTINLVVLILVVFTVGDILASESGEVVSASQLSTLVSSGNLTAMQTGISSNSTKGEDKYWFGCGSGVCSCLAKTLFCAGTRVCYVEWLGWGFYCKCDDLTDDVAAVLKGLGLLTCTLCGVV